MERDTRGQARGRNAGGKKRRLSRRRRQRRKVILTVTAVFLVLVFGAVAFLWSKYDRMGKVLISEKDVKATVLDGQFHEDAGDGRGDEGVFEHRGLRAGQPFHREF